MTLLAYRRMPLFGMISDGEMMLNAWGHAAEACWRAIPGHFAGVELDTFVVMPNHVHGIIVINRWALDNTSAPSTLPLDAKNAMPPVRATHASPLQRPRGPQPGSLAAIIGSYKSAVTRQINAQRSTPGAPVWHRNYYEHIIRTEQARDRIRAYIVYNPARWADDEYYA